MHTNNTTKAKKKIKQGNMKNNILKSLKYQKQLPNKHEKIEQKK